MYLFLGFLRHGNISIRMKLLVYAKEVEDGGAQYIKFYS